MGTCSVYCTIHPESPYKFGGKIRIWMQTRSGSPFSIHSLLLFSETYSFDLFVLKWDIPAIPFQGSNSSFCFVRHASHVRITQLFYWPILQMRQIKLRFFRLLIPKPTDLQWIWKNRTVFLYFCIWFLSLIFTVFNEKWIPGLSKLTKHSARGQVSICHRISWGQKARVSFGVSVWKWPVQHRSAHLLTYQCGPEQPAVRSRLLQEFAQRNLWLDPQACVAAVSTSLRRQGGRGWWGPVALGHSLWLSTGNQRENKRRAARVPSWRRMGKPGKYKLGL